MKNSIGRLLAVDLGVRRVGLAVSDPLKLIASPHMTITFKSEKQLLNDLLKIIREKEIECVIIGFPLNENGSESRGCLRSRKFSDDLEKKGIKTVLWDERYSSIQAQELLREAGLNSRKSIGKIDRVAASFILKDYISSLHTKGS